MRKESSKLQEQSPKKDSRQDTAHGERHGGLESNQGIARSPDPSGRDCGKGPFMDGNQPGFF
jgi:hypothetical protein